MARTSQESGTYKINANRIANGEVSNEDFVHLAGLTDNIQAQLENIKQQIQELQSIVEALQRV